MFLCPHSCERSGTVFKLMLRFALCPASDCVACPCRVFLACVMTSLGMSWSRRPQHALGHPILCRACNPTGYVGPGFQSACCSRRVRRLVPGRDAEERGERPVVFYYGGAGGDLGRVPDVPP